MNAARRHIRPPYCAIAADGKMPSREATHNEPFARERAEVPPRWRPVYEGGELQGWESPDGLRSIRHWPEASK